MKLIALLSFLILVNGTAFAQGGDYSITGTLKKFPENAMAYLVVDAAGGPVKDSAAVENGTFTFKGKVDEPRAAFVFLRAPGDKMTSATDRISFYAEPGAIDISSKTNLKGAVITGSPNSKDKQDFDKKVRINVASATDGRAVQTVTVSGTTVIRGSSSGVPPTQEQLLSAIKNNPGSVATSVLSTTNPYTAITEAALGEAMGFIGSHPKSFVSLAAVHALYDTQKITFSEFIKLFNSLDDMLKNSNTEKELGKR